MRWAYLLAPALAILILFKLPIHRIASAKNPGAAAAVPARLFAARPSLRPVYAYSVTGEGAYSYRPDPAVSARRDATPIAGEALHSNTPRSNVDALSIPHLEPPIAVGAITIRDGWPETFLPREAASQATIEQRSRLAR
jgi:hypothetical protein